VVEDYQKGYYLHERVLRPARVKVMVPASEPAVQAPQGPKMPPGGGDDRSKEGPDEPVGKGN
jgi:hypothetical protein